MGDDYKNSRDSAKGLNPGDGGWGIYLQLHRGRSSQAHDSTCIKSCNLPFDHGNVVRLPVAATTTDRLRTGALLAATAAQVLVPVIGPLLGQRPVGEVSKDTPSIVTPPDWAFGVWGPIFAASAGAAVVQALPGQQTSRTAREAGWWLAAAAAGNALWEFVAQSGRYRATPPIDLVWGEHPGAITLVGHRYSAVTVATDGAHPDVTGRRTQQPVAPPDDVGIA